ncbi:jg5262 [Pararge aegeria aegeria]|uniref:Jg5262 protein n=1 Tax=Pararge aegeria aegeria TaxID=348720 RepID=A0A8S4R4I4_9NEOP|nr:jg5262 [Pararge aegeria aegeria]
MTEQRHDGQRNTLYSNGQFGTDLALQRLNYVQFMKQKMVSQQAQEPGSVMEWLRFGKSSAEAAPGACEGGGLWTGK